MTKENPMHRVSRRHFLRLGLGLAGMTAAGAVLPKALLKPYNVVEAAPSLPQTITEPNLHFVASDGWIYLPGSNPPYHPDNMAPDGLTTYVFGFRNVTGLTPEQVLAQKMKVQHVGPMWWIDQETDFTLKLGNLGLQIRPDLIDAHTLHFHGFRDALPIFDGEPHSSVGVPIARELMYFYRPHHPGTYMYHCHFEETEHVHMGMTGVVFVRPLQDREPTNGLPQSRKGGNAASPVNGYTYNDGDGSTAFDREFGMCLTDVWTLAHWCDSHVQLPEWSDYQPDYYLLNGRVWPDTILPPGGQTGADGDLLPLDNNPDYAHLRYQPVSSLVTCNSGERILLRFVNLAFIEQTMRLGGIKMRVVGRDATPLRGRDGTDLTYETDSVLIGAGESADAIFVAPEVSTETTFLLHSRNYSHLSNAGGPGYGGQMTEVRVRPGTPGNEYPPQDQPNT